MKERRASGEPVLAEVGAPVILCLDVAGYRCVLRTEATATRALLMSLIVCTALSAGCAHRQAVTGSAFVPENVLAHALSWMVRVAPPAHTYAVSVEADPGLGRRALPGAARLSALEVKADRLVSEAAPPTAPSVVFITAELPVIAPGGNEGRVEATYQAEGGALVRCTVRVRMEGEQWLVASSSDERCWRKAQ